MSSTLVSVVLPLYNKAPFITRALDSIAAQTHRHFEAIVVDDGSADGSGDIAASYPDPRFRVIRQPNAGPGAARNRGVREAKGEIIAFLDGDDEWLPAFLEKSLDLLRESGDETACVTSSFLESPRNVSTVSVWRERGIKPGIFRLDASTGAMRFVHALACMSPCSTIVRADVFRKWGGFYENRCVYAEDAYFWMKILLNETVAFQLEEPLVRVHTDASGLSNNVIRSTPVEPFLTHPAGVESACPPPLRRLLAEFLAIRAFKRACVLAYWGKWREASALRKRFAISGGAKLPYWLVSALAATPMGAVAGKAARAMSGRVSA
jgi:hypothetical protein